MAFTITHHSTLNTSVISASSGSSASYAGLTGGGILLAYLRCNSETGTHSFSGFGGTWVSAIANPNSNAGAGNYCEPFYTLSYTTASDTLDWSYTGGTPSVDFGVVEVTGDVDTSGIGNTGEDEAKTINNTLTPTISGFTSGSLNVGFAIAESASAQLDSGTNTTDLFTAYQGGFAGELLVGYGEDVSALNFDETGAFCPQVAAAVEILASSGGILVPTGPWYGADGKQIKQHPG